MQVLVGVLLKKVLNKPQSVLNCIPVEDGFTCLG